MKPRRAPEITRERILELLSYDEMTGEFRWKVDRPKSRTAAAAGTVAGSLHAHGYVVIFLDGYRYKAHALAWIVCYGNLPEGWIDHHDRNRSNNAISNLRVCAPGDNAANSGGWKKTGTGLKGAYPHRGGGKAWFAAIRVNRRLIHLGSFDTEFEAHSAYLAAATQHFGDFACAGEVTDGATT